MEVTVIEHKMKEEFPNTFYMKAKEKSYIFKDENMEQWLLAINGAKEEVQERLNKFPKHPGSRPESSENEFSNRLGYSAPIMIPDEDAAVCQVCWLIT